MRTLIIGVTILAASAGTALAQDVQAGETSFRKCQPCHDVGPDAKNKIGPMLNGLDGHKSGSIEGYSYSDANKNAGTTWSQDTFQDYIKDPRAKMPGTKMIFPGIKDEKEAGDLWAYLAQFKGDGSRK
jgi:cytochrome c